MGEPGGIGPELAVRAWEMARQSGPAFVLLADPALIRARAQRIGIDVPLTEWTLDGPRLPDMSRGLPIAPLRSAVHDRVGVAEASAAPAVIESITRSVDAVVAGHAAAVVTNPIQKSSLNAAGFAHPGHTEFLGALAELHYGGVFQPIMMLASGRFRVVPVTVHVPLARVPSLLTAELIHATGRIVANDLAARFGIPAPRLAVAGLNPHAGEGGVLGAEDDAIVRPAIERLRADGIAVTGPHPADTLFHAAARERYDAALAMYHDQALIPIKTVAFDDAVNVTLGLPFVRTSPDHGTALDIAGTGRASPASLIAALRMAAQLANA
jgi:4-hydroxythreonine-4-phosphate dehydrogenase